MSAPDDDEFAADLSERPIGGVLPSEYYARLADEDDAAERQATNRHLYGW